MAGELRFHSYRRTRAAEGAAPVGGRLQGQLRLTLADLSGAPQGPPEELGFLLMGPRDVNGLKPGAVRRTYPANGAFDVETDKCVHAEFAAEDLPWRYSPDPNADAMRPWLLLIVGTPEEVTLLPGGRVAFSQGLVDSYVQEAHLSSHAHLWAHVQEHQGVRLGRVVSPRRLEPGQSYVAVLVPSFGAAPGAAGQPPLRLPVRMPLPAYYAWRFATSKTSGSFRDLAVRLHPLSPIPANIGLAPIAYQTASDQETVKPEMLVGGALVGLDSTAPGPLSPAVAAHFGPIRPYPPCSEVALQQDPDGRPIVRLSVYGEPWLAPCDPEPAWMQELNDDPRHRGVAGLGMWAGIEWQDRIVEAASRQLGAFYTASRRIRQLTVGLAASRSLWDRRLPSDDMHRLQVLGPAMARLATPQGASVLDHVSAAGRPMPPALFSSAARRLLRPGTARARLAETAAVAPGALFDRMNTCPPDAREHPAGLLHVDIYMGEIMEAIISTRLEHGAEFGIDETTAVEANALHEDERERRAEAGINDDDTWSGAMGALESQETRMALLAAVHAPYPVRPCEGEDRRPSLPNLSAVLSDAFNPHGENAFIVQRVLATIEGLDDQPLTPPELCLDFHLPAWKFLREFAQDWFLPGLAQMHNYQRDAAGQLLLDEEGRPIRDLSQDPVIAAKTNGRFTDAFLVGFNQQALGELRWRNVPVASGCTPLRRFWEPLRPEPPASDGQAGEDIVGIHRWQGDTNLGDAQHEAPEAKDENLVLVFKSQLWQRYPETLIYLLPALPGPGGDPNWQAAHITPNLHIEIEPDVVAFGFAQGEDILDTHWVVIEQVPRGFTFYNLSRPEGAAANQQLHSAGFAKTAFARPVRVLIRGTELKPQP